MNLPSSLRPALVACSLVAIPFLVAAEGAAGEDRRSEPLAIERVTPEGEGVEQVRQVVFQFSRPVAPLGRMERSPEEIGISFSPPLACEWRWINTSSLACNLAQGAEARPATEYSITVSRSFDRTLPDSLPKAVARSFVTVRPEISSAYQTQWVDPLTPGLSFTTNLPVDAAGLEGHLAYRSAAGREVPVKVAEEPREDDQGKRVQWPAEERGRHWTGVPKEALAPDTSYRLVLKAGLVSVAGGLPSRAQTTAIATRTFGDFRLKRVVCTGTDDKPLQVWGEAPGKMKAQGMGRCDPLSPVTMHFTAPVERDSLPQGVQVAPSLLAEGSDANPWEHVYPSGGLWDSNSPESQFTVSMPYGLKAVSSYDVVLRAGGLKDAFGRPLSGGYSFAFKTDHRVPRVVLDKKMSVLEKDADSELPIVVNNISSVKVDYRAFTAGAEPQSRTRSYQPYDVQDVAYAFPINVRELLEGRAGVVEGTISTTPVTKEPPGWFFSQVTPFGVHVKLGHFSSLAWVTSLSNGRPIVDARVTVIVSPLEGLSMAGRELASAPTDANGLAVLPGTETLDPDGSLSAVWERKQPRLMVRVERGADVALLPLGYDVAVYSAGVWPSASKKYGHLRAWGTTAQGLYKAGDTVQFALWVRGQDDRSLVPAPREAYRLEIRDPMGKVVFTVPEVKLSEFGAYSGEFVTSSSAAVGWYDFSLTPLFGGGTLSPLRVLISDFTPASFSVAARLNASAIQPGQEVVATTEARLLAGGPYADSPVRVTAVVRPTTLEAADPRYSSFVFSSGERDTTVFQEELRLNAAGDSQKAFVVRDVSAGFGTLELESAVRDDRGKLVAGSASVSYLGRDRYVGISQPEWFMTAGKEARLELLVIDGERKPVAGTPVQVTIQHRSVKVAQVKSAGNAYLPRYEPTLLDVGSCSLTSALAPVTCLFTPAEAGDYVVTAKVLDTRGAEHATTVSPWAVGKGFVLWEDAESTQLKVFPEKRSYRIGDKARFVVQNPFAGARALFTVERYGIMKSWIQILNEGASIIEEEVTADHMPGFFFSAVVMSPRVDKPIENQVDLGKPAFRMGYAEIEVVDGVKSLAVDVKPRGSAFKPHDSVTVDLSARAVRGPTPPIEYAVTVLDEGVFSLLLGGRDYFDPYRGFYKVEGLDVQNFNLLRLLIGRQKFEKKGANAGGDGAGRLDMRSLKKFVSYWNPAVKADSQGRAAIAFEVPDNLTGWKIFAMAISAGDRVGLGEGSFKVNKDTEVRPALPNQVREGDTFQAVFTVMNRASLARDLAVEVSAEGSVVEPVSRSEVVHAEPFKRYPVRATVRAAGEGEIRLSAKAHDASGSDGMTVAVPVSSKAQLQVAATFGTSDGKDASEKVAFPADMRGDAGSVGAVLSPSVIGGISGAFEYMRDYPYECWEQRISRGVMASFYESLRPHLPKSFSWPDARGVPAAVLGSMGLFQAPNGGMGFWTSDQERVDPYLSAFTALALGWLRDAGHEVPAARDSLLRGFLKGSLKVGSFPEWYSAGLKATVRAVALAALARSGDISEEDLLRFRPTLKEMSLFGRAHFLLAATALKASPQLQQEAAAGILSRASESGGKLAFVEPRDSAEGRVLDSEGRTQCAVLSALSAYARQPGGGADGVSKLLPKLARSVSLRQSGAGRWQSTQENLFCMKALADYSREMEPSAPDLRLEVSIGGDPIGSAALKGLGGEPAELSRPLRASDAGAVEDLAIKAQGSGRFYYSARVAYAPKEPRMSPVNAGIEVSREYSVKRGKEWTILATPLELAQGELVKVDLFVRLPGPRNFVVIDDPLPGGLEAVNRDFRTTSAVDQAEGEFVGSGSSLWHSRSDWVEFGARFWGFYHKELRHGSARFFSEFLPAGNYHLSYVAQAIAAGDFVAMPTQASEMYDPDVFGSGAGARMSIAEAR